MSVVNSMNFLFGGYKTGKASSRLPEIAYLFKSKGRVSHT